MRKNNKKIFIKDIPISSDFANLLLKVIDTGKISNDLYQNISDDEKNIFDMLLADNHFSGGNLNYIRHNQKDIDSLINKYNIIKGEILIGNNNPDLLKDLKLTVIRLVHYNVINMKEILPLLEYIFILQ